MDDTEIMRIAVVDLGTNTFNLAIAEQTKAGTLSFLYSEKLPVKIGEGGLQKKQIQTIAYARGLKALKTHSETIKSFQVEKVIGIATSAIRSTSNGQLFLDDTAKETGLKIEMISGEREAELIYNGIKNGVKWEGPAIIMDIGGGSTEFLVVEEEKIKFSKSFDLGVSRLKEQFSFSDPVLPSEVEKLNQYLTAELDPLFSSVNKNQAYTLIGSAGTFDTLLQMYHQKFWEKGEPKPLAQELALSDFNTLHQYLLHSTQEERLSNPFIPSFRADMITIGSLLVAFMAKAFPLQKIIQSEYSLKEGAIFEQLNQ